MTAPWLAPSSRTQPGSRRQSSAETRPGTSRAETSRNPAVGAVPLDQWLPDQLVLKASVKRLQDFTKDIPLVWESPACQAVPPVDLQRVQGVSPWSKPIHAAEHEDEPWISCKFLNGPTSRPSFPVPSLSLIHRIARAQSSQEISTKTPIDAQTATCRNRAERSN